MNDKYFKEVIDQLYEMVETAKSVPFSAEKCAVERNAVLNLLDELNERMPSDLKQARMMIEANDELVTAAKRKAEGILKEASEKARKMVSEEAVYLEAKAQANDMVRAAQEKVNELRKVTVNYVDEALRKTEEAIAEALGEVRNSRGQFRSVSGTPAKNQSPIIEEV